MKKAFDKHKNDLKQIIESFISLVLSVRLLFFSGNGRRFF